MKKVQRRFIAAIGALFMATTCSSYATTLILRYPLAATIGQTWSGNCPQVQNDKRIVFVAAKDNPHNSTLCQGSQQLQAFAPMSYFPLINNAAVTWAINPIAEYAASYQTMNAAIPSALQSIELTYNNAVANIPFTYTIQSPNNVIASRSQITKNGQPVQFILQDCELDPTQPANSGINYMICHFQSEDD